MLFIVIMIVTNIVAIGAVFVLLVMVEALVVEIVECCQRSVGQ